MTLKFCILNKLRDECMLQDEALAQEYVVARKKEIIKKHIDKVFPIKAPGEKGGHPRYWMTKLTPHQRCKDGKAYGKTKEEVEEKILAYYLAVKIPESRKVRDILVKAVGDSKTGKRTLQRFDKRLSSLSSINLNELSEASIRKALDNLVASGVSAKEYTQTITCLTKLHNYCVYEHLSICDIPSIVKTYRAVKLTGKHSFKESVRKTQDLSFSRIEASKIVRNAISHPSYKSLAVALLLTTGLRVGELLALTEEDIFLDEGFIWVRHSEDTKTYELLDYVKENRSREVYLSAEAEKVLSACIAYRKADVSKNPYLFLNSHSADGKLHCRAIDHYLRSDIHSKLLGYGSEREARSPHDCRRTYASLEYLSGTPIYAIQAQLGHTSIIMTEQYIKAVAEPLERKLALKGGGLLCINTIDDVLDADLSRKRAL